MICKKCDRCGKYYEPYNMCRDKDKTNGFMFVNVDETGQFYKHNTCDLCEDCMASMRNWLNAPKLPDNLNIKIKYFRGVEPIKQLSVGDWIDLRAADDVQLKAGEYKQIPLGVAMELPKGFEALVVPRSSTFKKYGVILVNSIGVIDEAYCGDNDEWNFLAYAVKDTVIKKNERICQFRIIHHQPPVELSEVEVLGNADRGGIGSTGTV